MENTLTRPDWKVLLIGGSSATGKSYLARQLALYYRIPLTEVDDIRIALQQVVDRQKHPALFYFLDHADDAQTRDASFLVSHLLEVAEEIWPALNELITKHIVCDEPVIFEGDGIVPELLIQRDLHATKSLFLTDTKAHLLARDIERHRGSYAEEGADRQAEFSFQYGAELENQARRYQFPVISTSPPETLLARVVEELQR